MIKIPIVFGWLHIHRKEQLDFQVQPHIVLHWYRARWMASFCDLVSKRLFWVGGKVAEHLSVEIARKKLESEGKVGE